MSTKVKSWKLLVHREIRTYCLVEMLCTFLKIIAKELDPHWADVNYSLRPPWKCTFHIWKKSSSIDGTLFLNFPGLGSSYSWKHKKKNILFIPKFPDTMLKLHACHAWLPLKLSCFRKPKNMNLKNTFLTNTNSYVYREIQDGPWTTWCNEKMISVPKTWHLFWPRDSSLRQQQHPQWQKKHTTTPQRQHLTNGICAIPKTSYI